MLPASSIIIPTNLQLRNAEVDNDKLLVDMKIKKGTAAEY